MRVTLGKYELLEHLGGGGYGDVYRARNTQADAVVAVKILKPELSTPLHIERFRREARLSMALRHANIVPVLDFDSHEGRYYIVMDYLPGQSLEQALTAGQPMPYERALVVLQDIAAGLDYAHKKGVLHRDLKPKNIILLEEDGRAVITDFGLARSLVLDEGGTSRSTGTGLGSPGFMAPEQIRRQPLSPQTDLYALGVLAFRLLSGHLPFEGEEVEVQYRHAYQPPPDPREINPALPGGVSVVLSRMLSKAPGERYGTGGEFVTALHQARSDEQHARRAVEERPARMRVEAQANQAAQPQAVYAPPVPPEKEDRLRKVKPLLIGLTVVCLVTLCYLFMNYVQGIPLISIFTSTPTAQAAPATKGPNSLPSATFEIILPTQTSISSSIKTSTPTKTRTITPSLPTLSPILGIGSFTISPKDGMRMVYVPEGEFLMGSTLKDLVASAIERPQHSVYLDAFWIDQTEVTNAMYKKCVQDGNCVLRTQVGVDDFPQVFVNWSDASAYCLWAGRTLPSEAQWEKAARGTDTRLYPWGNDPPDESFLNFNNIIGGTVAVGKYEKGKSPYGAYDMAGNAWEWVSDWYEAAYYSSNYPWRNPPGPSQGTTRVMRGGSYWNDAWYMRTTQRGAGYPTNMGNTLGFRCVQPAVMPVGLLPPPRTN